MILIMISTQPRPRDQVSVSVPWLKGVCHGSPPTYKKYGTLSLTILKLAPIDRHGFVVGGLAHRRLSGSRFYWRPDLFEMGNRLDELEADRDVGKPGAQERLESFREQRMLLVDSIVQVRFYSAVFVLLSAHVEIIHETELRRIREVGQG